MDINLSVQKHDELDLVCHPLISPIPFGKLHRASVLALTIAAWAASTEVVNPNDRSIRSTSLSIVWSKKIKFNKRSLRK